MSKKKLSTYIFNPGRGVLENVVPNAYSLIESNKEYIKDEAVEYINYRIVLDTANDDNPDASAQLAANNNWIWSWSSSCGYDILGVVISAI